MAKPDSAGFSPTMGDLGCTSRSLKHYKVAAVELRENELELGLKRGNGSRDPLRLKLKGIIGFKDTGVVGKPLERYSIEDKGSHKVIALERANGATAFRCSYMEGEIR